MTGKGTAKSGLEWWGILMVPGHPEPGKGHWSQIMWHTGLHLSRGVMLMGVFRKIISIFGMGIMAARRHLNCYNVQKRSNG